MRYFVMTMTVLSICFVAANGQPPNKDGDPTKSKKGDAQSTFEPKSGPGEGQTFLKQFVGDWTVAKAFYPRGGGEPSRATGECKQTMIHDGRFLQSDFVCGTGDTKTTGMGLIGFESSTGRFTSVWTDSRQTRMSFRQGQEKFDGMQIVLFGKGLGDEKQRESKTVTKLEDNGQKIVHRQYGTGADGQERLVMELVMIRKPISPPAARGK
jgi:Protein of unknown function (DUF1579)